MKRQYFEMLVQNLQANSQELLSLAANGTQTPIKYHQQDFEYVQSFLLEVHSLWETFKKNSAQQFRPKGKVLFVLSANEPFIVTFIPVIHALLVGNQVHLKPASINSAFVVKVVEIITDSIPEWRDKLFVHADISREAFEDFVLEQRFNFVHWFGSVQVIKKVAPFFATQMIEFNPECEGNDVIFVDKTADISAVVPVITHSLVRHNGQCCNAIKGIFVHTQVLDTLLQALRKEVAKLTVAGHLESTADVSITNTTITFPDFIQQRGLQENHVVQILQPKTGTDTTAVPTSTEHAPGILQLRGYSESLLASCSFMPLQWLIPVVSVAEVITAVNESPYGLGITIFSDDDTSISSVVDQALVARININRDPLEVEYTQPWGGIKASGHAGVSSWFEKFINYIYIAK